MAQNTNGEQEEVESKGDGGGCLSRSALGLCTLTRIFRLFRPGVPRKNPEEGILSFSPWLRAASYLGLMDPVPSQP